ncbi:acetylglutamate kinase [Saccharicrinis sp. FJH54]|uniref:acetylglutamate kinase n=1 Tax=Saccharicrinis sp. FJH54 TaxID=3344665 RepID=UPI0035D45250
MKHITVVKVGGKVVEDNDSLQKLLKGFCAIEGHKLLVHGGGRMATTIGDQLGIESKYVNGRRITDEETLKVVTMVYGGLVNKSIVARLQAMGCNAIGLTGADMNVIEAHKRPVKDIDYGYAGDINRVNAGLLADLIHKDVVPVMAPLTHDLNGGMLNTNADTIASEVARALTAYYDVSLVYCFEKKGVLLDEQDDDSVISKLTRDLYKQYVDEGRISGGMIPKLDNAYASIDKGVKEVIITRSDLLHTNSGTTIL